MPPGTFEGRPAVVGHRGMGAGVVDGRVQNTMESFLGAVEAGADWVEVDVRRTRDDVLVVAHDPAYDDGVFVVDVDGHEVAGRGTARVEDVLAALPPGTGVLFDLKSSMEDAVRPVSAGTAALLAPVAAATARHRPVTVTSFDPAALVLLASEQPDLPLGLITWLEFPTGLAVAAAAHLGVRVLSVHMGSLRPNRIEPEPMQRPLPYVLGLAHEAGLEVQVWNPRPEELQPLVAAGVDAMCVNDVPRAVSAVAAARAGRVSP
jgi:glycerophosphoryl diester phosphodiesterase